jgi:ribosomal protein S19
MFNLLKPKISATKTAEGCVQAFALIISSFEDKSYIEKWLNLSSETEVKELVGDSRTSEIIQKQFNSDEFLSKYKRLNEFELELVRMGIYRAAISMPEFICQQIEIWDNQRWIRDNKPGMRVSWKFPKFSEYRTEFFRVKMLFIGHFPDESESA